MNNEIEREKQLALARSTQQYYQEQCELTQQQRLADIYKNSVLQQFVNGFIGETNR